MQTSSNTSLASWTTNGISFDSSAATFTNTTTAAGGTVATQVTNSFNRPTFASTNAITVTNGSTVYIANDVLQGTNTTITNSHALHIAAGRTFMGGSGTNTIPALAIRDVNTGLYSSATNTLNITTGGSLAATFGSTGNLTVVGTVTANSDIRLKKNIKPLSNSLEKIIQLNGVEFDRIDIEEHQIGLIAQEVEEIIPEIVFESDNIKSIAYQNLVAVLVEAIKELKTEVDELKKNINN
jgi:hypothetical protein